MSNFRRNGHAFSFGSHVDDPTTLYGFRAAMWCQLVRWESMRLVVIVPLLITCRLLVPCEAVAEERLRSSANDGANAAAILGRLLGVEIPPGRAGGDDFVNSLADIQSRLQRYGVANRARILSYQDLASFNQPCIVPLRAANAEKASFYVFVQAKTSEVHVVDAGPLIVRTFSVDDFRRYWTGYAVFGNVNTGSGTLLAWSLFGTSVPLCSYGGYVFVRRRRGLSLKHI